MRVAPRSKDPLFAPTRKRVSLESEFFGEQAVNGRFLVRSVVLFWGACLGACVPVRAQDNYEIQVYAYDQVEPHHTMVELHSNFTIDGSKTIQNGPGAVQSRNAGANICSGLPRRS